MDALSFLYTESEHDERNATLSAVLPDGEVWCVSRFICPFKFLEKCPLLYHAFEYGYQSRLCANVDAPSKYAITSLVRYCYTGNYLDPAADLQSGPVLLLPHVETYKISEDFDVPELQLLAHGNFSCQIDFACCMPTPPQDLSDTIRFVYQYYSSQQSRQQHGLVGTLLNYCISVFLYHKLGDNVDLLLVASEIPEFRQDLCRTNLERNFEDECALDIIRFSLDSLQPQRDICPTTLASRPLPKEMICDTLPDAPTGSHHGPIGEVIDHPVRKTQKMVSWDVPVDSTTSTLVHRPKIAQPRTTADMEVESASEDEGFSIVHRPSSSALVTPDEPMTSPELIPSAPTGESVATDSGTSSDDDWTML